MNNNSKSHIVTFRVSSEERKQIRHKAELCGISTSDYVRQCAVGHSPKLRMTEAEIEAFNSLTEARGELVRIKNALKGKTQEQRKRYFENQDFMLYWINAVDKLIRNWYDTLNRLAK